MAPITYAEWCREKGCDHGHCPRACEHPQPFGVGRLLYCGRCEAYGELVEMEPCTPEACERQVTEKLRQQVAIVQEQVKRLEELKKVSPKAMEYVIC